MIELILGVGAVSLLLLYIAFSLDSEHIFLKFFLVVMVIYLAFLIPKATIDAQDYCDFVKVNETISGNTTTYGHDYRCVTNTNNTALTFFKTYTNILYFFGAYLLMYVFYTILDYAGKLATIKKKAGRILKRKNG